MFWGQKPLNSPQASLKELYAFYLGHVQVQWGGYSLFCASCSILGMGMWDCNTKLCWRFGDRTWFS